MSATVQSFDEYKDFIQRSLAQLAPLSAFKFCFWCVERYPSELDEVVWDGLTPNERHRATEIIAELRHLVEQNTILSASRAATLRAEIESFGPQGDDMYQPDAVEFEPEALEFLTALSITLGYCRDQDVTFACSVSESWINIRDYRADAVADYGLLTMFNHPDLKRELELQESFIASLEPR
jgi:hypothetical protein